MKNKIKILITTGIYPPKIGGPSQYAKNLKEAFEKMGHKVKVKTYGIEEKLPTGLRHLFFFFKIIPALFRTDTVFILDTFSVALPTVLACKIFDKKSVIRTGGDFLWENYVERSGKKILLKNFYNTEKQNFSFKEKIIFKLTKWILNNVSKIIFSTEWQRDIFVKAYKLSIENTRIIENYYGAKESDLDYESKAFISSSRNLVLKNKAVLKGIFEKVVSSDHQSSLFDNYLSFDDFTKKMAKSYAVICISISEISPNIILDAIRYNRPFICTKEVGIFGRIKDAGIFVDPLNKEEIEGAVLSLLTGDGYWKAKEKIRNFSFVHTWEEISNEILNILKN